MTDQERARERTATVVANCNVSGIGACARCITQALLDFRKEVLEEVIKAIPFPGMAASSANAIASHVEDGQANGGLLQASLVKWLRTLAVGLGNLDQAIRKLKEE